MQITDFDLKHYSTHTKGSIYRCIIEFYIDNTYKAHIRSFDESIGSWYAELWDFRNDDGLDKYSEHMESPDACLEWMKDLLEESKNANH